MIVSMWMTRDVVTIDATTPITEAAALMAAKSIRRLPVVEKTADGPRLKGIVSATDILHAFPPHVNPFAVITDVSQAHVTASEIMSRQLTTTTLDTPIEEAARTMRDKKIGALPVVRDGILAGLITESDIFRVFVSLFDHPQGGVRVTFGVSKGEDIFTQVAKIALGHGVRVVSLFSSEYHDRTVWVVHVTGKTADDFLDELRTSEHRVLNVVRLH